MRIQYDAFIAAGDTAKATIASEIRDVGEVFCGMEIRSAQKYWHIRRNDPLSEQVYPTSYTENVVGILWSQMIEFGTFFGLDGYLVYGIQLLPITPVSELREG